MKKIISFIITIIIFSGTFIFAQPQVSSKSAIVIEEKSGAILFAKDENAKMPMASTTKIMTALTVLKYEKNLNKLFKIPIEATKIEGSSMYLKEGEQLSILELLNGLLITSGNDAAKALAIAVSGNQEKFVKKMNDYAKDINLKNTIFKNPSGLPAGQHFTTAFELALITREAFKFEEFRKIVSSKKVKVSLNGIKNARYLNNHNKLLSLYIGCDGVKTGWTKEAGRCLVSSATRDGVRLIAVTLNAPNDWQDHKRMLDYSFTRVQKVEILKAMQENFSVNVVGGTEKTILLTNALPLSITKIDNDDSYIRRIELPEFVYAPIKENQVIGKLVIIKNGFEVSKSDLVSKKDIEFAPKEKYNLKFKRYLRIIVNSLK